MKPTSKFFILFVFLTLFLAASIYFSSKKLRENENTQVVVVDAAGTPPPLGALDLKTCTGAENENAEPCLPPTKKVPQSTQGSSEPASKAGLQSLTVAGCKEQVEYKEMREQLGLEVNKFLEKRQKRAEFAAQIDNFRLQNGLPLPLGVSVARLSALGVVFDNCKAACHGDVNEVFVTRVIAGSAIEVRLKSGVKKIIPLREKELSAASIDQLDGRGVPFRSWLAPMIDGPWYIAGDKIYYKLDMEGLALEISSGKSEWKVVATPEIMQPLQSIEPVKVAGCSPDEQCLRATFPGAKKVLNFKAPNTCAPAVRHADDEPAAL